ITRWSMSWRRSTSTTSSGSAPKRRSRARGVVAGAVAVPLANLLATGRASAQTSTPPPPVTSPTPATRAAQGATPSAPAKHSAKASRYRPDRFAGRAGEPSLIDPQRPAAQNEKSCQNPSSPPYITRTDLPMRIKAPLFLSIVVGAWLAQAVSEAETKAPPSGLNAAQIVDKHVAACGGLQAWRAAQTLTVAGKLDAGSGDSAARSEILARQGTGASAKRAAAAAQAAADAKKTAQAQQVQLPFRLEMKRPRKSRLEIDFAGKTAVQVYDGQNGWKFRPYLNRDDVEPFTADEAKSEAAKADIEGPLLDYAAKGTQVGLEGMEPVDGHNAYKLKVTPKNGEVQHIWIDAQSFLDVKVEGVPRRMDGKMRNVFIY